MATSFIRSVHHSKDVDRIKRIQFMLKGRIYITAPHLEKKSIVRNPVICRLWLFLSLLLRDNPLSVHVRQRKYKHK